MIPRSLILRPPDVVGTVPFRWSRDRLMWAAYLVTLLLAELALNLWYVRLSVAMLAAMLAVALVHASFAAASDRPLLVALALAPVLRLTSLGLPLAALSPVSRWALAALPLGVAAVSAIAVLGLSRDALGIRFGKAKAQFAIATLGVPLGLATYVILRPPPSVEVFDWRAMAVPALVLLICAGLLEELLFRGIVQSAAREALGQRGIVYAAAVSAVLSIGFLSILNTILVFATGLVFGRLVARTGSLLGVSLAHGIGAVMAFLLLPILLSPPPAAVADVPPAFEGSAEQLGQPVVGPTEGLAFAPVVETPVPSAALTSTPEALAAVPVSTTVAPTIPPTSTPVTRATVLAPVAAPTVGATVSAPDVVAVAPTRTPSVPEPTATPAVLASTEVASSGGDGAAVARERQAHVVQPGETLADIATVLGTSIDALVAANGIVNPDVIVPGQRLQAPVDTASVDEYIVQRGDTLLSLAQRFGVPVNLLASANGLSNPDTIRVGQALRLPPVSGPVPAP